MGIIGQQIKKYRLKEGLTQETLGRMIGVTTQAVSKWERGSSPDAELLPLIADALGIDIDTLFGREELDLQQIMSRKLSQMPPREAFRYTFNFCWSAIIGLSGDTCFTEDFNDTFVSRTGVKREQTPVYYAQTVRNDGMALARLSGDFDHFFLMAEPQDESIRGYLEDIESIRKVFGLFADKDLLKVICYLYSMPVMPLTATLIGKETELELFKVEQCLKTICDRKLAYHMKIATVDGVIDSYSIRSEASCVIPLLCFADQIAKGCPFPVFNMFDREKAFLSTDS